MLTIFLFKHVITDFFHNCLGASTETCETHPAKPSHLANAPYLNIILYAQTYKMLSECLPNVNRVSVLGFQYVPQVGRKQRERQDFLVFSVGIEIKLWDSSAGDGGTDKSLGNQPHFSTVSWLYWTGRDHTTNPHLSLTHTHRAQAAENWSFNKNIRREYGVRMCVCVSLFI